MAPLKICVPAVVFFMLQIAAVKSEVVTYRFDVKNEVDDTVEQDRIRIDTDAGTEEIQSDTHVSLKDYRNNFVAIKNAVRDAVECLVVRNRQKSSTSRSKAVFDNFKASKGEKKETVVYITNILTRPLTDEEKKGISEIVKEFCGKLNMVTIKKILSKSTKSLQKQQREARLESNEALREFEEGKRSCCVKKVMEIKRVCEDQLKSDTRCCNVGWWGQCDRHCVYYRKVRECYDKNEMVNKTFCPCPE